MFTGKNIDKSSSVWLFLVFFFIVLIRNAWVSDDAYITFRSIENFIHGYGLTYNVGERVQAFTHPLWFFWLSTVYYGVLRIFGTPYWGGLYYLSIFSSIGFSLAALILLGFRIARSTKSAILGLVGLLLSKAFIDYTTSGLENPLTYFLLALFVFIYFKEFSDSRIRMFLLSFVTALATLNRLDVFLLLFPLLVYAYWSLPNKLGHIRWISLGFVLLLAWEVFSLFYYGFLFPNTAYAKLNTGIPSRFLFQQGILYLFNSLSMDPLTLLIILFGLSWPLITKQWKFLPFVGGIFSYMYYTVSIGGDFMSGRFLAAPLFLSILLVSQFRFRNPRQYYIILLLIIFVGLSSPFPPVLSDANFGGAITDGDDLRDQNRITDERAYYYPIRGLLTVSRFSNIAASEWVWGFWEVDGKQPMVVQRNAIGRFGYISGPNTHILDPLALVDPLLARLPVKDKFYWSIGHFSRNIPLGYYETLETDENKIEDPNLRGYYDNLSFIISGELFSWDRIIKIWNMNIGKYDYLIDAYYEP